MTCIVGLETSDAVYIGGDSAAVGGWDYHRTGLRKVFRRGPFLIGYTTSFRMGQLLQYKLDAPAQSIKDPIEFMATVFADAVRTCLKDGGFAKVSDSQESGGTFLVGYCGRLYQLSSDFHVNTSRDGFMAVGLGAQYALGAISAASHLAPRPRLRLALKTAGHFSIGVCGPYRVYTMPL